ncbi:MAG: metallophosphoesterase, partial [Chlamydiia bacterium]|nr:metallophosphoesterase [Chlamydiia bacterium]
LFFYSLLARPTAKGYNVMRFGSYLSLYLLDSNHSNPIKGAQTDWLKQELAKEATTLHRFAIYHVPAYPSVRSYRMRVSCSVRRHWVPLFEKYGLNIALENNDHAYKRTYPMKDGSANPDGVVYIGDGSWGVKPRVPKKAHGSFYLAKTESVRQFLKIELSETKREFWSLTPTGDVVDHYIQFVKTAKKLEVSK